MERAAVEETIEAVIAGVGTTTSDSGNTVSPSLCDSPGAPATEAGHLPLPLPIPLAILQPPAKPSAAPPARRQRSASTTVPVFTSGSVSPTATTPRTPPSGTQTAATTVITSTSTNAAIKNTKKGKRKWQAMEEEENVVCGVCGLRDPKTSGEVVSWVQCGHYTDVVNIISLGAKIPSLASQLPYTRVQLLYDVQMQLMKTNQEYQSNGTLLTPSPKLKSNILDALASEILKDKAYPSSAQFDDTIQLEKTKKVKRERLALLSEVNKKDNNQTSTPPNVFRKKGGVAGRTINDTLAVIDQDVNCDDAVRDMNQTVIGIYVAKHEGADVDDPPEDIGIVVEGVQVLQDLMDVANACALLFGVMYCLNLSYPSDLKYTFEFLQKILMELDVHRLSNKIQIL
ncbi:hypothetical protein SKAU_G00021040 [Synaphobranchus kaupii]|uniref:Uncharacterized protein n=1 Tax=Synaphobranchus kaupii TaxID=118154 RepID=A0A9Q1JC73_SYNKA|nr:hypothetical protein SKAU_G00021040 [Synaphobranchus kaupii]